MTTTVGRPQLHKSHIDLEQHELRNPQLHQLGADPGTPVNGQFLYRTDTHEMRVRVNGAWQNVAWESEVGAAGIPGTIFDAKGDIIVGTAADTYARKAVGANGTVLFPNSAQADGLEWRAFVAGDIQTITTDRLLGRDTTGTGVAEQLTVGGGVEFTGSGGIQTSAFTGDVTKTAGGTALTIPANTVDNTRAADMAQALIKGRASGAGTGDPTDLTASQVKTILAYLGSEVAFTPTGNIASSNVQAAIAELETDLTALINSTVAGQKWKDPVDAATTGALPNTPTYNSGAGTLTAGANAAFPTTDGVTAAVGQDYLVKDQASTFQNGIYTLTTLGSGAAAWVLTRRSDADINTELQDAAVMVEAGTTQQGTVWTQVNAIADLTAAAQSWIETNRNEVYTAGTGLGLTGNQFNITDNELLALLGVTAAADRLPYFDSTTTMALATFTSFARTLLDDTTAGGALTTLGVSAFIQTLLDDADAATARTTLGATTKYATSIGNGSLTSFTVTHNLNTRDVTVEVIEASTFEMWEVDWAATTVNTITVTFTGHTPTTNQFRVVVVG